jgi:hypothetical protein
MSEANHRLAGIMAADVVGYSAMIGKDRLDAMAELLAACTFNRLGALMAALVGLLFAALSYLPTPGHG